MKIPDQYLPVMPYIIVNDASAFKKFAEHVFGATEQLIVPTEDDKIMHGEIRIGEAVIMFANSTDEWKEQTCGMFLYVDQLDKIYEQALVEGATSIMQPAKKEYGYSAGFNDPFGNQWWITEAVGNKR